VIGMMVSIDTKTGKVAKESMPNSSKIKIGTAPSNFFCDAVLHPPKLFESKEDFERWLMDLRFTLAILEEAEEATVYAPFLLTNFIFAKEQGGHLLLKDAVSKEDILLGADSLAAYFATDMFFPGFCPVEGWRCLEHGARITIGKHGVSAENSLKHTLNSTVFSEEPISLKKLESEFCAYFQSSIPQNSVVGIPLSGGIDSAGILGFMRAHFPQYQYKAISVGAYGKGTWDLVNARKSAQYNGVEQHELYPVLSDLDNLAFLAAKLPVLPRASQATLMYQVAKKAKQLGCTDLVWGVGTNMLTSSTKYAELVSKVMHEHKRFPVAGWLFPLLEVLAPKKHRNMISMVANPHEDVFQKYLRYKCIRQTKEAELLGIPYVEQFREISRKNLNGLREGFEPDKECTNADMLLFSSYAYTAGLDIITRLYGVNSHSPLFHPPIFRILYGHRYGAEEKVIGKKVIKDLFAPYLFQPVDQFEGLAVIYPYNNWMRGEFGEKVFSYCKRSKAMRPILKDVHYDDVSPYDAMGWLLLKLLWLGLWYDIWVQGSGPKPLSEIIGYEYREKDRLPVPMDRRNG